MDKDRTFEVTLKVRIDAETQGEAVTLLEQRVLAGGVSRDEHAARLVEVVSVKQAKR